MKYYFNHKKKVVSIFSNQRKIQKEGRKKVLFYPTLFYAMLCYPSGLDHPIPAGILENPKIAINHTHAVNTNGPVSAGNPHCPKNR